MQLQLQVEEWVNVFACMLKRDGVIVLYGHPVE